MVCAQDILRKIVAGEDEVDVRSAGPIIVHGAIDSIHRIVIGGQGLSRRLFQRMEIKGHVEIDGFEVQVQVAEGLVYFTLPDISRPVLVPIGLRSKDRRFIIVVPVPLELVIVFHEKFSPCAGSQLEVELGIAGGQPGLVCFSPHKSDLEVLNAVGAVKPGSILDDRPAEIGAVKINLLNTRRDIAPVRHFFRQVMRLPGRVLGIHVEHPGKGIPASSGDHVELHAAGLGLDVVVAVVDLDFLVAGDVEVGGSGSQRRVVGDVGAVDVPGVILAPAAVARIAVLLTGFIAADVFFGDQHPGHQGHQDPRIPGRGKGHDHLFGDVHADLGSLGIDDGALADDGHFFLDGRLLHNDLIDIIPAIRDHLFLTDDGLESLQFKPDPVVIGDGKAEEPEIAAFRC